MRILILHSRYRSGPVSGENRVVDDEVKLLRDAGHSVSLLDPMPREVGGVELVRAGINAIWSRAACTAVVRRIRATDAELVHCHNVFPALSPAVLRAAASEGRKVVMTLHNFRSLCLPATFVRDGRICEDCLGRAPWPGVVHACYRGSHGGSAALAASLTLHRSLRTFDRASLYLAVSEFVKRKHVQAGWRGEGIRVKSNFAWPSPRREGPGEYFLYIGRLAPEKGIGTLLEAWEQVSARLLVVGDGPDADALKRVAPSSVEFIGAVSPSDVSGFLRRARAVLMPSICYEGQPRGVLEAYAAGVPVAASDVGSLPELVVQGVTGLHVTSAAPDAWAAAVRQLLDDEKSERLGEGAWRLWRDRFTPERGLDGLESAYERVLRGAMS